jgi:hypothetical protein
LTAARRERTFLIGSALLLLVALVAGIWMLLRARAIWSEAEVDGERAALLERRDELRGQVAEITAANALKVLPRDHATRDAMRDVLTTSAARYQQDPLDGNPDHAAFACVGFEMWSGEDGIQLWTSAPIAEADRTWCLMAISAGGGDRGRRHVLADSRVYGIAWRAFVADGEPRLAGLFWLTPRVR